MLNSHICHRTRPDDIETVGEKREENVNLDDAFLPLPVISVQLQSSCVNHFTN